MTTKQESTTPHLPTPQVILSYDLGAAYRFALERRTQGSFSSFQKSSSEAFDFVFTDSQNSNLLSFTTSWGRGSSSQAVYELEILDPTAEFEHQFFEKFYNEDGNSWKEIVNDLLSYDKFGFGIESTLGSRNIGVQSIADRILEKEKAQGKYIKEFVLTYDLTAKEARTTRKDSDTDWGEVRRTKNVKTYRGGYGDSEISLETSRITLESDPGLFRERLNRFQSRNNTADEFYEMKTAGYKESVQLGPNESDGLSWEHTYRTLWEIGTPVYDRDLLEKRRKELLREYGLELYEPNKTQRRADKFKQKANPFGRRAWISFGVGDNLSNYSPPVNVKLFNVDYGLSFNKVRTLTLEFVPSPSLAGLEVGAAGLTEILGTNDVNYNPKVTLSKGSKQASITDGLVRLIEEAYRMAVGPDCPIHCLAYDLKTQIEKKFGEIIYTCAKQKITEKIDIKGDLSKAEKEKIEKDTEGLIDYLKSTDKNKNFTGPPSLSELRIHAYLGEKINPAYEKQKIWARACKLFFSSLGINYHAYFDHPENNTKKVGYSSLGERVNALEVAGANAEAARQGFRPFIKAALESFAEDISFDATSPAALHEKVSRIFRSLSPVKEPAVLINFPEVEFIQDFNERMGLDATQHAFVITKDLWKALQSDSPKSEDILAKKIIQAAKSHQSQRALDKLNPLQTFVGSYKNTLKRFPQIQAVEGMPDPYSYLEDSATRLGAFDRLTTAGFNKDVTNRDEFEAHLRKNKIPVFVHGFKNSNVLNFNFDLKSWFYQFLRLVPHSLKNNLLSAALQIGDGENLKPLSTALDILKTKGKAGEEFEKAVKDLYESYKTDLRKDSPEPLTEKQSKIFGIEYDWRASENQAKTTLEFGEPAQAELGGDQPPKIESNVEFIIPDYKKFRENIIKLLLNILEQQEYTPATLNIESYDDLNTMTTWQGIQDKLAARSTFAGTIETFPICSLMSPMVVGRSALFYMVEPKIISNKQMEGLTNSLTWLSGEYYILGYEAQISEGTITTSFDVQKKPQMRNFKIG